MPKMVYKKLTGIKIFELLEVFIRHCQVPETRVFFFDLLKEKVFYLMDYLINYDLDFKGMARIARLIEREFTQKDQP